LLQGFPSEKTRVICILSIARTIADLESAEGIREEHIFEAINYRSLDRRLW
jgi:magnesium chelatase family protein